MNLCSKNHSEICHEGVNCPICPDIENMQEELNEYENQITDLEKELEEIKKINS